MQFPTGKSVSWRSPYSSPSPRPSWRQQRHLRPHLELFSGLCPRLRRAFSKRHEAEAIKEEASQFIVHAMVTSE